MSYDCADKNRKSHYSEFYRDLKIDIVGRTEVSAEDGSKTGVLLIREFEI